MTERKWMSIFSAPGYNIETDGIAINLIIKATGEIRQIRQPEVMKYTDHHGHGGERLNHLYAIRRLINKAIKFEKEYQDKEEL
jgi:hypothetical protein